MIYRYAFLANFIKNYNMISAGSRFKIPPKIWLLFCRPMRIIVILVFFTLTVIAYEHVWSAEVAEDGRSRIRRQAEVEPPSSTPKEPHAASLELVKWLRTMSDPQLLDTGEFVPEDSVDHFERPYLHGCRKDKYKDNNRVRTYDEESFCFKTLKIDSIEGGKFSENEIIDGKEVKVTFVDGSFAKTSFKAGRLHGIYRKFWCKFGPCDFFDLRAWRTPRHLAEV